MAFKSHFIRVFFTNTKLFIPLSLKRDWFSNLPTHILTPPPPPAPTPVRGTWRHTKFVCVDTHHLPICYLAKRLGSTPGLYYRCRLVAYHSRRLSKDCHRFRIPDVRLVIHWQGLKVYWHISKRLGGADETSKMCWPSHLSQTLDTTLGTT